jgi:putative ABC transport system ATP-binding protein
LVVLNQISFTLSPGNLMGLVGGNGSGKTTLINIIAGDLTAGSGSIALDGTVLTRMPNYRRAQFIGRVHQESYKAMASELTVKEVLAVAARRGKALRFSFPSIDTAEQELSEMSQYLMDFLQSKADMPTHTLSGGERQLLALTIAVLGRPRLLLLDEHRASLDEEHKSTVDRLLLSYLRNNRALGITATHDRAWVQNFCTCYGLLAEGSIQFVRLRGNLTNT